MNNRVTMKMYLREKVGREFSYVCNDVIFIIQLKKDQNVRGFERWRENLIKEECARLVGFINGYAATTTDSDYVEKLDRMWKVVWLVRDNKIPIGYRANKEHYKE